MTQWSKIMLLITCAVAMAVVAHTASYPTGKSGPNTGRQQYSDDDKLLESRDYRVPILFDAAMAGNIGAVRALVEKGADVNQSLNGATPLCFAHDPDVIRYLIEKGADVNVPFMIDDPRMEMKFLVIMAWVYRPGILALAYRHGLTRVSTNVIWSNVFYALIGVPDKPELEATLMENLTLMLDKGADVNVKGREGETPLTCAVRGGSVKMVNALIDKGADVNAKNDEGRSVLTLARQSKNNSQQLVDMLLRAGAR
jgi:ankyrin repeat protein